ncbi:MAG: glycosyltransferase family 2 protein [Pseudomonadota bacterium]|nr:glycosyltransferase family 2 protein [Pseudomonadota bacterium]
MDKISAGQSPEISISVVSHAQIQLLEPLLHDIGQYCQVPLIELILTLNLDEILPFAIESFAFPIKIIRNPIPMGFATNHNQAFTCAAGQFFCVMNPDVRLNDNPFQVLLACLQDSVVGVAAPLVLSMSGEIEDSARRFPTPLKIFCKAFGRCKGSDYLVKNNPIFPDWVGGMFMLFPRQVFKKLGGFDQRYFLYYEDVDLCARLRLKGYEVAICPDAKVIHLARRSSHQNFKYLKWHLMSMMRFFCSFLYLKILWLRLAKKYHEQMYEK